MKFHTSFHPQLFFVFLCLNIKSLLAEAPSNHSTFINEITRRQPVEGTYQILYFKQIQQGGRTISYYWITTPQLTPVVRCTPQAPTAEDQALTDSRIGKAHGQLAMGCTVFDHEVTELHWTSSGRQHVAYSNVDFSILAGLGTFDSPDTVYSLLLAVGNATRKKTDTGSSPVESQQTRAEIPELSTFPQDVSVYYLSANDVFTEADHHILSALDALHAYYDANKDRLRQQHLDLEQKRLAKQQWEKEHPPQATDQSVYIWKKEVTALPDRTLPK